jgi:hypothetical protein
MLARANSSRDPIFKITRAKLGVAQVAQHLPYKHEALSSNAIPPPPKKVERLCNIHHLMGSATAINKKMQSGEFLSGEKALQAIRTSAFTNTEQLSPVCTRVRR